jgi:hypothetical protein
MDKVSSTTSSYRVEDSGRHKSTSYNRSPQSQSQIISCKDVAYKEKMFGCGRSGERVSSGLALERNMKKAAVNIPPIVAWTSPSLTPSRYITLSTYAVARQLRPRILNICRVKS